MSILEAIKAAKVNHEASPRPNFRNKLLEQSLSLTKRLVQLSPRESETLDALLQGISPQKIAEQLGLSNKTINTYTTRAYEVLGISDRLQLFQLALAQGWLSLPPQETWQATLDAYSSLSNTDKKIIALKLQGETQKAIGSKVFKALKTVAQRYQNIKKQLGIKNFRDLFIMAEVVQEALAQGMTPTPTPMPTPAERLASLAPTERRVIDYLLAGKTNSQIASIFGANIKTTSTHTKRAFDKLRVNNYTQFFQLAVAEGWLALPPKETWQVTVDAYSRFSDRDKKIFALKVEGNSDKTIGSKIFRVPSVVSGHFCNIREQLGAKNLRDFVIAAEVVKRATEEGIVPTTAPVTSADNVTAEKPLACKPSKVYMPKHAAHVEQSIQEPPAIPPQEQWPSIIAAYNALPGIERQIFMLKAEGRSHEEISDEAFIDPDSIVPHLRNIRVQLGIETTHDLLVMADVIKKNSVMSTGSTPDSVLLQATDTSTPATTIHAAVHIGTRPEQAPAASFTDRTQASRSSTRHWR